MRTSNVCGISFWGGKPNENCETNDRGVVHSIVWLTYNKRRDARCIPPLIMYSKGV